MQVERAQNMTKTEEKNFNKSKKSTIKIATQLCYPQTVINKLETAQTENELTRIMITARLDREKCYN